MPLGGYIEFMKHREALTWSCRKQKAL